AITIISTMMTACSDKSSSVSEQTAENTTENTTAAETSATVNSSATATSDYFSEFDLKTDYSNATAQISLDNKDTKISGSNAVLENNKISINSGGTYVFSGKLDDGQIYVNCDENVQLVFNGVDISNSSTSPVFVENAKNVLITLAEGTENILTDSENYVFDSADENEPDAVIFSKDDLSMNGSGTLTINANYNEGITTKNDLRISDSNISITSKGNGIKGKDSVVVQNTTLKINAGEDGIKSSNAEETDKGYIVFESGEFDITAENDAVQSENSLMVNGGSFNITTGGGAASAPTKTQDFGQMGGREKFDKSEMQVPTDEDGNIVMPEIPFDGDFTPPDMQTPTDENGEAVIPDNFGNFDGFGGERADRDELTDESTGETLESQKGFKSGSTIIINGGAINADCSDDTLHSTSDININGGDFSLSSGDDGIHSDANVKISSGNIIIRNSYEGIEGVVIDVDVATVDITASDDGFNSSDGSGNTMNPMAATEGCELNINGGKIYVNSGGDALDSNGTMTVNGGVVLVDGPENDGNSALDSGLEIKVNGGVLIAAGSSGMLETPSDSSEQNVLVVTFDEEKSANTPVYVQNENGETMCAYTPSKKYSAVVISSPEIADNKEYSVYSGGSVNTENSDSYLWKNYTENSNSNSGELVEKVTVSDKITRIGNGSVGMMDGGMNHGGRDGMKGNFHDENMQENFNGEPPQNMPTGGMEMPADGNTPVPHDGNFMQPPVNDGMNPFNNNSI
ncbi:MAG: carbohydrate-binding domain-containing protein, partial [Oscillospiraceae bacterium]|nr:carbohydrate-binding domain-containing protein [Oscillospiraceae bacterium]